MSSARYRLGVDVGGTHTDLVLLDTTTGELSVEKVASTPKNPALGVLEGIARFITKGIPPSQIGFFAHGTTITTNALLEMRGAKVGLLITQGYRAVQEIQNQARDGNLFDYFYSKPAAIAPQRFTKEIPERCDYAGRVLRPLDKDAVRRAARELKDAGVESIAVCYLFSFMNPAHEQETRALIQEECPAIHVSLSSEVLPRIREWPRLSTTLLNAYLEPVMVHYISHLNQGLDTAGLRTQQRFLMQSNGGVMPFSAAIAGGRTVHTLFSGPAAGAQASAYLAREDARRGLVTLDMGGTSADIAFIEGGAPLEVTEGVIARRQVDVPALDMTTISAGGGSIAWIDGGGFLNVGPQSAGADPGPAAYGLGGDEPTVSDADVVLGWLDRETLLGGALPIDLAAAKAAIRKQVADPLGMGVTEAAAAIVEIVNSNMAEALRIVSVERGHDPREFALIAFGGAGPVHAAALAAELDIPEVIVPPAPGAFSALGLVASDLKREYSRTLYADLRLLDPALAAAALGETEAAASEWLATVAIPPVQRALRRAADLRYRRQAYELTVPFVDGPVTREGLDRLSAAFHEKHRQTYGHANAEEPVQLVNLRLTAIGRLPGLRLAGPAKAPTRRTIREAWFPETGSAPCPVHWRDGLAAGEALVGPTIIEAMDSTIVVPPGWIALVEGTGYIRLRRR